MCLNCTLAKEVHLFPGLGLYSGIFVIYLQCPSESNKSRTANIVFYVLCLLYILSAATFVGDVLGYILEVRILFVRVSFLSSVVQGHIRTLSLQLQIDLQPTLARIGIARVTMSTYCDFISQCIIVRVSIILFIFN